MFEDIKIISIDLITEQVLFYLKENFIQKAEIYPCHVYIIEISFLIVILKKFMLDYMIFLLLRELKDY